jgi:uncharacterized membrane protein
MTIEALKALLDNPMVLFAAMMLTQLASIVGQWYEAKTTGSDMGLMELFTYWPQLLIGFGASLVAFVGLVESDTLNFASAIGIGGMVNKVSDLINTRRARAVVDSIPNDTNHGARK